MKQSGETTIIGGGLAGSMAALELAAAGRHVTLIEKSGAAHDKVCGEFLSRESLLYLARHSIHPASLGGVPLETMRFVAPGFTCESPLPFAAWSLTRRVLDEELLRRAARAGGRVLRGRSVTSLKREQGRWSVTLQGDDPLDADNVFLATGKHNLQGWPRPAGRQSDLVAFKMYYRLTAQQAAELGHAVELIVFPGGYAGLQPVEEGVVNLCLVIASGRLQSARMHTETPWETVLQQLFHSSSHLANRLHGATALLTKPLAASRIAYGHLERRRQPNLWRLGDQAAVIPSFCGDGMSIALHSGALAASYFLRGSSAGDYQERLYRQLRWRMWIATHLSGMLVDSPRICGVLRPFPDLLRRIALMTRIPERALLVPTPARD